MALLPYAWLKTGLFLPLIFAVLLLTDTLIQMSIFTHSEYF